MSKLFNPIKVGRIELSHRIAMAPMTRYRADDNHVPLPTVKEYYAQRTAVPGSLAITEATFITQKAGGYANVPGIYNQEQIDAWKEVVDAVHKQGSFVYLQLWALGRTAHEKVLKEESNADLVSASDIPTSPDGTKPRPLTDDEILQYIEDYTQAAKNAIAAGFDGVEIHGANGYLIEQFIQELSNKRTDAWGGSIENRARFALEVTKSVVAAIGADRTGIRFSPFADFMGNIDYDPTPQYVYLVEQLKPLQLAYIHFVESREKGNDLTPIIKAYDNTSPVIVAGGFEVDSSKKAVDEEYKDYDVIVGIGRPYTSNPDLPFRFKQGIPLTPYQRETFFTAKLDKGFHDFPFSEQFIQLKAQA
ncbi:aldolase-type tim barrel [Trichoderma arundinaceum]|uniref:Aldolase-type tim barrel n=1 Tax=Trichoderma arundinaceum TaxID=490622 RepID=A0A395NGH1_TRIAR|nr:aldolase-type tim barrel [Trichoderma arundinaceum]